MFWAPGGDRWVKRTSALPARASGGRSGNRRGMGPSARGAGLANWGLSMFSLALAIVLNIGKSCINIYIFIFSWKIKLRPHRACTSTATTFTDTVHFCPHCSILSTCSAWRPRLYHMLCGISDMNVAFYAYRYAQLTAHPPLPLSQQAR